jgi:hypothetical protein
VVGVVKGEWLQINTPKPIVLTRYEIQGRQGCCGNPNGRDPNTWYILGFKDGEWYQVDYQTNISFNFNMLSFNISNPAPYTAYRIVITVCGDNKAPAGQRSTVQIGQWNLFNSNPSTNIISYIDDNAFRNGSYKALASSFYNNTLVPQNIFNSLTKNTWLCETKDSGKGYTQHSYNFGNYVGGGTNKIYTTNKIVSEGKDISDISGEWIQIELPYTTIMTSYNLITSGSFENFPGLWSIVGSNTGITWELIDRQEILSANINNVFNISKPVITPYSIFRLIVSSVGPRNNRTVLSYYINLAKWNIFGIINSNYVTTKNELNLSYSDPSIIINYDFKPSDMKRIVNRKNNELIGILSNQQSIISSGNNKTYSYPTFNDLIISQLPRNSQIGIAKSKDNIN